MAENRSPFDHKHDITITIDEAMLAKVTGETLALWWHVAQANPADGFREREPGEIAMKVGWEIIRRWLSKAPVEMYHHQQGHYSWDQLRRLGKWNAQREFVPHAAVADPALMISAFQEAALWAERIGEHQQAAAYERARKVLEESMWGGESGTGEPEADRG
jgi:hypothetical protein